MKIAHAGKLAANIPTLYYLTAENWKDTQALLPASVQEVVKLSSKQAEADEITTCITPKQYAVFVGLGKGKEVEAEKLRQSLHKQLARANDNKLEKLQIAFVGLRALPEAELLLQALAEVCRLGTYQFLLYRKERVKLKHKLSEVHIHTDVREAAGIIAQAASTAEATCLARDLVNEPPNVLTPVELAKRAQEAGRKYGFRVEVFGKKKIQSLKMGGLLAVNRGSQGEPTFSILEHKPAKAKNKKPIVLVGKGITFDTGGLSLKPTPGSMDSMKSDMAGAAAVIGALSALAANKVPVHVIGLIPSTDNRPGEDAYTPNDVITHYDGTTVEVLNTDAEGRLILADALAFAKQYDPELVIDLATLTGAAVVAVGPQGIVLCSTASEKVKAKFKESAERTYERVVEMPLWKEYRDLLKSDIADMKNIGGRYAGALTAAKFLEHFTSYPWIHLDIAGPAYLDGADSYRGKNGTGVGVRLLTDYLARNA